jgi:hypothetical protein
MATSEARGSGTSDARPSGWTVGFVVFAAVMMMLAGGFQTIAGIAAIFEDEFFVVAPNYVYDVDVTASGATWARIVGITLASLSAFANFFFIPYYPLWSIVIIALDVAVIWALTVYGRREASAL